MKRSSLSLRAILFYSFLAVGLLPLLVMGYIAAGIIEEDIERDIHSQNLLMAQSLAAEVELFLRKSQAFLRQIEMAVVAHPYIREEDINAYLENALKINQDFESVELLDEQGAVRHAAPADLNVIGVNRSGHPFYVQTSRQNEPFWSPSFISLQTGNATLTLSIPVSSGMIVGYLNLSSLTAITNRIGSGVRGYAMVLDRTGVVIAHPDGKRVSERHNLKHLLFGGEKEEIAPGNFSYREGDGEHLASLSFVPETRWMVISAVPAEQAFAPVARLRTVLVVGALLVVLVGAAIISLTLRKALPPIGRLVRDTRRLADGDYSIDITVPPSYREIDDLVHHFRQMTDILHSREETLKKREERFRAFVRNSSEAIWCLELEQPISTALPTTEQVDRLYQHSAVQECNAAMAAMHGYRHADEVIGLRLGNLLPRLSKDNLRLVQDFVENGYRINERETVELSSDGGLRYFVSSLTGVIETEQLQRIWGVKRDVTERKQQEARILAAQVELQRLLAEAEQARQALLEVIEKQKAAEEEIRRLNTELERRVRDRTAQLEAANKELEAFAYSVSHDLRAPLRAMDGFSAALFDQCRDQLDERGRHFLNRIQMASQRMGQLINDLLKLSRVSRGEMVVGWVDLSRLAEQIARELRQQDPQRTVEFTISPGMIVQGDGHLLHIALDNLLGNAWKFTERTPCARIDVGMTEEHGEIVYFVRDNGVGFNMAYAEKLFAPFQRLHGMQEFAGTGIGLATVHRIISRHGGRIWPEAAVGQGATFYFTLGESHE